MRLFHKRYQASLCSCESYFYSKMSYFKLLFSLKLVAQIICYDTQDAIMSSQVTFRRINEELVIA